MPRPKERIPIVLKHIDWLHYLDYIGSDELIENVTKNKTFLKKYWLNNPDLRLTQVLINLDLIENINGFKYYIEEVDYLIENGFVKPEDIYLWGTYGKDGNQPLKYIPISKMESSHIEIVLKTQNIRSEYFKLMKKVLRKRKLEHLTI